MKPFLIEHKDSKEQYTILAVIEIGEGYDVQYLASNEKTGDFRNISATKLCTCYKFKGFK